MTDDRKCARCGDPEFRINGYCSCECEDLHERELLIGQLRSAIQSLVVCDPVWEEAERQSKDAECIKALEDSEWCAP